MSQSPDAAREPGPEARVVDPEPERGPLDGILVVDLTRALAGPHAAMMLGDLGARVIKVESAEGDDTRGYGPPFVGPDDEPIATYFLSCNRNKESIVLDLKSDDGRRTLTRLVQAADVLVENFRPGVLDRLGFTAARLHEINPALVFCSITGFGHDGPSRDRAGYDVIAQSEAGLMSLTGPDPETPVKVGVPIADLLTGIHAVVGILAALVERAHTGRGRVVRTSLLASVVGVHAYQGTAWTVAGQVGRARGNDHASIAPYGLYHCRDGQIQVAVGSEGLWRRFAGALGIDPDAAPFATNPDRVRHREALTAMVEHHFARYDKTALIDLLVAAGVPAGEVRTLDRVYGWDQTASQGLLMQVEHPVLGTITLPGSPLRFDDHTWSGGREHPLPPPRLGEHGRAIRAWLDTLDGPADPA